MSFFEPAIAGVVVAGLAGLVLGTATLVSSSNQKRKQRKQQRQQQLESFIQQNENERAQAQQRFERSEQQNRQRMEELNRRYAQQSTAIENLNAEIQRQEQRHSQRIREMQNQQRREIQQINERISSESNRLQQSITHVRTEMEQLRTETQEQFNTMQAQRQRDLLWTKEEIQNVHRRTDELEQQIAKEKEQQRILAEYWIAQSQRILADIRENYRPEKFEPQAWRQIQLTLANAQNDFQAEMFQIAVSSGRTAFQNASDLRDTLIEQELEWQKQLETANAMLRNLLTALNEAELRSYQFELDGEMIEDDRGVDYWTYGQLSVLSQRIEDAENRLHTNADAFTTEQLTATIEELHTMTTELAMLENAAAVNLTMANERYHMAVRIGEVLGDEYLMDEQEGDYFASENRDEYHASFTNPDTGEQAVVVVTPLLGENGVVTNHAELIVHTQGNNPNYRQKLNDTVVQNLSQEIPEFKLPCSEQYGSRTNEEAERLGNISTVSEGKETVRSQCSLSGVAYGGRSFVNPATSAKKE